MFLLPAIDAHFCVLYVPLSDQFPFCHNPSGQLACATKKKNKKYKKKRAQQQQLFQCEKVFNKRF